MNTDLITQEQYRERNEKRGIAYVVLLIYLTIMTCLGLSFIQKVGLEAKIVMNKTIGSQAQYLAESAASHAMWGLLNVPGFAPDPNVYYMQSLANGRYGYKVRKPTGTTFATIATVGVIGDSIVEQGYVPYILASNGFTAYGNAGNIGQYRRLIGADWTAPDNLATGATPTIQWVELEGCPIRKELVGGVIDSNDDVNFTVWDGTGWGNQHTFTNNADMNYKCFDIAYESQSGNALVVGRDGAGSPLKYNIWDGNGWNFSNPQIAFSLSGGNVHDVVMASQPGGNEILIAVVTSLNEIQLVRWNGSAFSDLGIIETAPAHNDFRVVEIVYEHQSGDAMVVWSRSGNNALKFRMWNGAALGPEGSLPDFGRVGHVIRGAADSDPASDYIIIGAIDNMYDINVAVWDGAAWIDSRELETQGANYWVQCFDIAWEASGEDAVVVFSRWGETNVKTLAWKKGAALADSTIEVGPSFQGKPWMVRLLPIAGTEKIVLLGTGESNELRYCLWTGDQLKGDPAIVLEPTISAVWDIAFDLAEANVPRTGGTGSGGGGGGANVAPTVDAGDDQTVCPPLLRANLSGTVTDDGLPDPPNLVTTTWTKESGPGTVTFDDDSLLDTRAIFSEPGEYVIRLTADDNDLSASDDITITVEEPPIYVTYGSDTFFLDMGGGGSVAQIFSSPKHKQYNGSTWGMNVLVSDLRPLVTEWMEVEAAFNKEEMIMGAAQDNDSLHLAVFDGTSWGNPLQFTSNGDSSRKCYDIAYESQSGEALVVGREGTSSMAKYTVWDGSSWTHDPPANAFDYGGGDLDVVEMESSSLSDEILVAGVDGAKDLFLYQWDGNSFNSLGILDDWVAQNQYGIVRIVHEQQSGDALIIWSQQGEMTPKYRIWDGSTLGGEQNLPTFGSNVSVIQVDADPTSDYIFVAGLDANADINVAVWDGDSWTDSREIETSAVMGAEYVFDVAWMPSGTGVLVGWFRSGQTFLNYFDWTKGTALSSSSIQAGPSFSNTVEMLQLTPLKTYDSIMVAGANYDYGLHYTIWDGSAFTPNPSELIVGLMDFTVPTFDVVELEATCVSGGGGGSLLFVVPDASSPSTQDNDRKTLMEGWGWTVTFISASATQAEFDAAVAINEVAYVTEQITPDDLNTKLRETTIGVVNEEGQLIDDFGMASGSPTAITITNGSITDNTHYITSPFALGDLVLSDPWQPFTYVNAGVAAGVQVIATVWNKSSLMVADTGAELLGATPAAGRRVQLPWGSSGFDFNAINVDGQTIMKRALEWGAASGGGGGGSDTDPPTPDPMTWASPPAPAGPTSITMTATTATDPSGVKYYFECTAGGGNDSGWIDDPTYVDTGLTPDTLYTYRVKVTDKASPPNETGWSTEESATTPSAPEMFVTDIAMGFRNAGQNYFGQATVWIKDDGGADVSGALVMGDWSGAVSEGAMGTTGGDGKIFFESAAKKFGGTFTFTVTDVSKSGYVYNPALNVMTTNSITAP